MFERPTASKQTIQNKTNRHLVVHCLTMTTVYARAHTDKCKKPLLFLVYLFVFVRPLYLVVGGVKGFASSIPSRLPLQTAPRNLSSRNGPAYYEHNNQTNEMLRSHWKFRNNYTKKVPLSHAFSVPFSG